MSRELFAPWEPRAGEWDRAAALHLFRRAGFGASPSELEQALADGPAGTLARLLQDRSSSALRESIRSLLSTGEIELLQAWWMALILEGGAPLRERMAVVWHDHFATSNDKVGDVRLMHAQNELFRDLGLGDFRVLLRSLARDPALILWLDGDSNRRGHPNENFARELMELFTLGIGNYTERDVQEAARAFSGWGTQGRAFAYRDEHHDGGEKVLLGRSGPLDGEQVLAILVEQDACARHIGRMLLEAFVAPAPPADWVTETARVLLEQQWSIERTLRILLTSRLFYSPAARRTRIAGPVELVAVAARALGARLAPATAARLASDMGQALFRPPSVKGWDGGRAWIHSGSWIARHNALVGLARGAHTGPDARAGWARERLAELALGELLPDGADQEFATTLAGALEADQDAERARTAALALVLTAPEYQLF